MDNRKKKRSENWSTEEKDVLRELIAQSRHIIKNKNTKASSNKKKTEEWKNIAQRINVLMGKNRSDGDVKLAWKRMKLAAKANLSTHRNHQMQTGGGEKPKSPSQEDLAIMAIAPHDFIVEFNNYDSDANKTAVQLQPLEVKEVIAGSSSAFTPSNMPLEYNDVVEVIMDQNAPNENVTTAVTTDEKKTTFIIKRALKICKQDYLKFILILLFTKIKLGIKDKYLIFQKSSNTRKNIRE
ncbi:uncharacterized protein LOC119190532 isoform X2 [Manduca sexta]|uniref:uncharacterized protein LOC119190532 isoform X2 n=1 Tax=Manduca sexta TaxID=7130 RepID=UPI00188F07A0|nr:uncharacterized protein LOC119190532 isoform X2 [Manduca sexta]